MHNNGSDVAQPSEEQIMDVLRTPDSRFEHLVGYPFA
ncbi:haloalkane dehalogenase, partial [Staphylococcus aureus]